MKTTRKILKSQKNARKSKTFRNFISLIFSYILGNPEATEDQEQLLVFWLDKIHDTRDMTVTTAVNIARWINTEVSGLKGGEDFIFEQVPA